MSWLEKWGPALRDDDDLLPIPGWQRAGFKSEAEAEEYKARARAQYGRSVSFPWDGFGGYRRRTLGYDGNRILQRSPIRVR